MNAGLSYLKGHTMATIDQRLKALETEHSGDFRPMPLIVDENVPDAELERLRRNGRVVYRSGDPAFYDEFV